MIPFFFFCGTDETQSGYRRWILMCFEAVSGHKVNLGRFEIIPVGEMGGVDFLAEV